MNNKLAGALAIGALSLTFGGCSAIENMVGSSEPWMTRADACVQKTIRDNSIEAASAGVTKFKVTISDMQKIKADCEAQGKGEFSHYLVPFEKRMKLGD